MGFLVCFSDEMSGKTRSLLFRFSGVMSLNPIHSDEMRDKLIFGSYTKAWNLGHAILESARLKSDPLKAILERVNGSRIIGSGKVWCFCWEN